MINYLVGIFGSLYVASYIYRAFYDRKRCFIFIAKALSNTYVVLAIISHQIFTISPPYHGYLIGSAILTLFITNLYFTIFELYLERRMKQND